jgi:hypothetical protein
MVPESAENKQRESEHPPEFLTRFLVTVAVKIINALQIPVPEIILSSMCLWHAGSKNRGVNGRSVKETLTN